VQVDVTTYHLEMNDPAWLRPKPPPGPGLTIARVDPPTPEINRFFYTAVGGDWYWVARLPWTFERWFAHLSRPGMETWVLSVHGVPAGYFELDAPPGGDAEIRSFGLIPRFTGQGLGGYLLTAAVERAWQAGCPRVWLHTCSLDHPTALKNYMSRGFRLFRTEVNVEELPPDPIGPWPGAGPREPGAV
jgi:GNAT superfamily N-acetyltransferase